MKMMIDLQKMLQEDDKYKQVLEALSLEEKEALQAYMANFMQAWQTGVFDPVLSASKEPEFAEAFKEEAKNKNYGTK